MSIVYYVSFPEGENGYNSQVYADGADKPEGALTAEEYAAKFPASSPDNANPESDRLAEINSRLTVIDAESARPMRAIIAGAATEADTSRLAELEAEAETLREERKTLAE
jgi:hypothetical protein